MSCEVVDDSYSFVSTQSRFLNFQCSEWWVFALICLVNVGVIVGQVYVSARLRQGSREMLLTVPKYKDGGKKASTMWLSVFRTYMCFTAIAQFLYIMSFLLIVSANAWQLALIVVTNILSRYFMYRWDWIPRDVNLLQRVP